MSGIIASGGILFLALMGLPLFIILTLANLMAFSILDIQLSTLAQDIYRISSAPVVSAILLFGVSAYLITKSRSPKSQLLLPIGFLAGFYGGFVTLTEAASLTAFCVLVIDVLIYKDLSLAKDAPKIIVDSMSMVGGILLILGMAIGLRNIIVDEEILTLLWFK